MWERNSEFFLGKLEQIYNGKDPVLSRPLFSNIPIINYSINEKFFSAGIKALSEPEKAAIQKAAGAGPNDLLLFFAGPRHKGEAVLGKLRTFCSNLMRQKKILPEPPKYTLPHH